MTDRVINLHKIISLTCSFRISMFRSVVKSCEVLESIRQHMLHIETRAATCANIFDGICFFYKQVLTCCVIWEIQNFTNEWAIARVLNSNRCSLIINKLICRQIKSSRNVRLHDSITKGKTMRSVAFKNHSLHYFVVYTPSTNGSRTRRFESY